MLRQQQLQKRAKVRQMKQLASKVLDLDVEYVPDHWVYTEATPEVARAITLRNAMHVLIRAMSGEDIALTDPSWHNHFSDLSEVVVALRREGYLGQLLN